MSLLSFAGVFLGHFVLVTLFLNILKPNPSHTAILQPTCYSYCPPLQWPSPHIELDTAILEDSMGKSGSVALVKATCQADSHSDIYIIILLLITLNIFIEGNRKASWGKNGGIYDSQCSRLIHFLITGKYIGIACQVVRFNAKTNSKQCLLRTQYMEESIWINSTFFLNFAS